MTCALTGGDDVEYGSEPPSRMMTAIQAGKKNATNENARLVTGSAGHDAGRQHPTSYALDSVSVCAFNDRDNISITTAIGI
ncbi:hypothetical protein LU631_01930 [Erwinia tracheiphila]|uniref:Uncharacterized protein n=2 Tax=Erwinia tracheiphila TaxID=65700 RepID=A0A0M2KIQ1_9GAMM|nr:hypothetical protein [Erwinia tracheiphila]EOS94600.1 hypothetical protein ETR_12813 [Erwinia tracheiphila PSU-1]KKF36886.1 hypothetical protein SY86_18000 [Erwinia tracheiphila]UIA88226.1 hypothetical protein LU631_01930 [Erwinia tracheiphila]UIA96353.1 hypothetical protein LU633_24230 [Erwinia tracheiphila]